MQPENINSHLRKYWHTSVRCFEEQDYPLACFFAITLIEEVGKVIILGYKELGGKLDTKGFRDHKTKYVYATYHTLAINSRFKRLYASNMAKIKRWLTKKELFNLRNNCLYLELSGDNIVTPQQVISQEDAFLVVCISGEVLAEIQGGFTGTGPNEWAALLREVDNFRQKYQHPL